MPSVAGSQPPSYLPPLDRCLSGHVRLISWSLAHEALTSPDISSSTDPLRQLLSDDSSIKALAACLQPPKPANGQSRADFENRTASINVAPSGSGQYDIKQIKDDCLWLAKLLNVDQVTALRAVILDWQNSPDNDILDGYSEEETLSLQQSIGNLASFSTSTYLPPASFGKSNTNGAQDGQDPRAGEARRQSRIVQTFLREQERLLATAVFLETARTLREYQDAAQPDWVLDVAQKVADARAGVMGSNKTPAHRLQRLVDALERHLQLMGGDDPSTLPHDFDSLAIASQQRSRLLEAAHLLRLIFLEAKSASHLRSTQGISSWFRIMDTYAFLQPFQVAELDQQTVVEIIQSLASLISAQLLDLSEVRGSLHKDPPPDAASWYVFDNECCRQICATMNQAAIGDIRIAAPAMLCWSMIGLVLRSSSDTSRRLSLDSDDGSMGSRSPVLMRSDGTALGDARQNFFSEIEMPLEVTDKDTSRDPVIYLAEVAIGRLEVYDIVSGLSSVAKSLFGPGFTQYLEFLQRQTLLDVIRQGSSMSLYGADLLGGALAVLRPDATSSTPSYADVQISNEFLNDEDLCSAMLSQAQSRYPFELASFLQLFENLAAGDSRDQDDMPILTQRLRLAPTFTLQMPHSFNGYELIRAGNAENAVRLTGDLELFASLKPYQSSSSRSQSREIVLANHHSPLVIPKGTPGRALNDTRPFVGIWEHRHSVFAYLAALLSTALPSSQALSVASQTPLQRNLQADVIRTFTSQIKMLLRLSSPKDTVSDSHERVKLILEEASDSLYRDQDIVSIVGELLETELSAQPLQSDEDSVDILASCVSFLEAVLPVLPDRTWPQLARIGLADTNDRGGKLSTVIASIEIAAGKFSFLHGCLGLFNGLVKDVICNALPRQGGSTSTSSRFKDTASFDTGIPQNMMGHIVESFTRLFLDVLRSTHDWRFADVNEQLRINVLLIEIFSKIVRAVYAYDNTREPSKKLTGPLVPAAKLLIDTYCGPAGGDLSINAVMRLCSPMSETALDTVTTTATLVRRQSEVCLMFMTLLLQVGDITSYPSTSLKQQLFRAVPALVRIYVGEASQRKAVARLLTALTVAAGKNGKDVPSLFGHLGTDTAQKAILIFSQLGKPLDDQDLEIAIWDLFSAAVSNRQQWFAAFLLTGSVPNRAYKGKDQDSKPSGRTAVLDQALDALAESSLSSHRLPVSMLQFVTNSVNNWPWCVGRLKSHPKFLERMCFRLIKMETKPRETSSEHAVNLAWQVRSVSLLSELFAMYLHHCRRLGDSSFADKLAEAVYFFRQSCVGDPSYAASLHSNLKRNLERKLPSCNLASFQKSLPNSELGPDFFYDLEFASEALSAHVKWRGEKRESGFEAELMRANNNLSLVEAQMQNLKSWKLLAIEFSNYVKDNVTLQKKLAYVVHECLDANRNTTLEALVFEKLAEIRAEIALPVLQRLVDARSSIPSMRSLLPLAWNAVLASEPDFDVALAGEDAGYYRLLLRLLLLTLQPHAYHGLKSERSAEPKAASDEVKEDEKVNILLSITREVVSKGFKSLCEQAHEHPYSVLPSDFSLLTTIFQSVLRVHTHERSGMESKIAMVLTEQSVARYATSLFSWSDRLTAANDDPIYGEISILFLYEMSSIPAVAEMLASEGVLGQLSAANTTAPFRSRGGSGAFDEPTRLFTIWSRGILPVCLNVLVAAGESFASEVASFLDNLAPQLQRAGTALDPQGAAGEPAATAGRITLNSACEAHTLALIQVALAKSGQEGTGVAWQQTVVKEDVETWVHGSRAALRERITPTTEKELALQRMVPLGRDRNLCGCENRLEEMVLQELKGALFVLNGGNT